MSQKQRKISQRSAIKKDNATIKEKKSNEVKHKLETISKNK